MASKAAKRRRVTIKAAPWNGDHGTGTAAAQAGTVLEEIKDNPNRMARRKRVSQIDELQGKLSLRQYQAAKAIQDAYCKVEMQSSGAALKEQVDSTPKPDAVIAAQVDATSRLVFVMGAVPTAMRDVVEHICWHNLPMRTLTGGGRKHYNRSADLKVALDLVANRLRY